ncbi:MAG TPA: translation initiation factor IF-2 associated domain-containing protein, partial [Bradyrhizobium sp.]|nr:translation initiation factor IF-2 associated domain-containing protein [Bradyrhizobium sp.]
MADNNTPGDKKLSVPSKTLTLKPRVETGTVRQSFPHGRSKQVVVEKRGKRRIGDGGPEAPHAPEPVVAKAPPPPPAPSPRSSPRPTGGSSQRGGSGVVLRTLTEDERSARASALADARVRDVEERRIAEEEARRRAEHEAAERVEREAAEARRKAEDERHRQEEESRRRAELEAKKRFGEGEARPHSAAAAPAGAAPSARPTASAARPQGATARPAAAPGRPGVTAPVRVPGSKPPILPVGRAPGVAAEPEEEEAPRQIRRGPGGAARPVIAPKPTQKPAPAKQRGRLTVVTALTADDVRERSIASFRRRTQRLKGHAANEPKEKLIREVVIPEAIGIQELANRMA